MPNMDAMAVRWDILKYVSGCGIDLGCGDARPHDWIVGIDTKPGTSGRGPNMILDARNLSLFADKSQDFVFSSHLLNELDNRADVLKEWWRIVKDNGYLILFLPQTGKKACDPKEIVDYMLPLQPWQFVEARSNGEQLFHVYRKCNLPSKLDEPKPEKTCVVVKLGAHGDALWASSVFPGLKEQGYHTILYTQTTGETMLRHDPYIDELVCFESRVPLGELGELFQWLQAKYKEVRILVECCEGVLLPSPAKIQYHWPLEARHAAMNINYLDMHHLVAKIPLFPKRMKFYPCPEEMQWANEVRAGMKSYIVVIVPNGSGCSKHWPYAPALAKKLSEREDVTVVILGEIRDAKFDEHPNVKMIGMDWDVRKAMTFVQMANVVVGQETGLVNCVGFENHVHKIVLMTHSSEENLTRDWPNTDTIRMYPECAGKSGCHLLHFDWGHCTKDETTQSALCQAMISADMVFEKIDPYINKHWSDCAMHNEPAYPNEPCDCDYRNFAGLSDTDKKVSERTF